MDISELQRIYAGHPNVRALAAQLENSSVRSIFLGGLHASASSLFLSSVIDTSPRTFVFILGDVEEAGYFYHDLIQINGEKNVLFFPSSYRRAIRYGQKDAANEILRTEALNRLQKQEPVCIVTYPDAIAEKVVSQKVLAEKTITLSIGQCIGTDVLMDMLAEWGFEQVDYVYEPGQYSLRGSIVDVYSYASEYPYRIDFFGDEIDSIRTFEVESQLSKERKDSISIVPELASMQSGEYVSFFRFLKDDAIIGMKDFLWIRERIDVVHEETVSKQALEAADEIQREALLRMNNRLMDGSSFTSDVLEFRRMEFGNKPTGHPQATLTFDVVAQPIIHKNFDLVSST